MIFVSKLFAYVDRTLNLETISPKRVNYNPALVIVTESFSQCTNVTITHTTTTNSFSNDSFTTPDITLWNRDKRATIFDGVPFSRIS